jgi:hypothetical protein
MTHPDLDITLDGVHFRLRSPLTYTNLATLAPKIVVGDYTQDNNELLSTWVMNDYTGGHGVADLMPADSNRYRWARGIYTRYPNQWSLPYRLFDSEPNTDGIYQPLCDALVLNNTAGDIDWRHVAANGRRIYVDNIEQTTVKPAGSPPDAVSLSSLASNKGVVFRGNGDDTLVYIPRGNQGYSLYFHRDKQLWNFPEPQFVSFCVYDNKVIGVNEDGQLWQAIRSNDTFTGTIANTAADTDINVSAADRKYSVGSVIQIENEQMKVKTVAKTKITVQREYNGTTRASHTPSATVKIYGQWYRYGGKTKLQNGTDVRDVIVYNDQNGQPAVHIVTDRDVWIFDESGPTIFRTALTFPQKPYSGIGSVVWRGDLYVSGGMDIYRYNGSVVTNVGLSRDDGLPRNYRGYVADLTAGPNGLYALVCGRMDNSNKVTYWSVHEFSGAGWHTIWAESMEWPTRTLGAAILSATATTITLNSNARIERGDILRVNSEDMRVNSRGSSNQVTVRRGVNGTTAATHSNGDTVRIKSKPSFIHLSQAFPDEQRLFWGVGFKQYYQRLPSEALNPREEVETNTDSYGFGFDGRSGTTYELWTGRFDGQMPGYVKIANGVEMRLRRLPPTQVLRVYYRLDEQPVNSSWKTLGVVAGGDVTTLSGSINSSTTTINLTSTSFCKKDMYLRVGTEVMTVVSVNGNTVTVARGSSPTSHNSGATVLVDFRIGEVTSGRQIWRMGSYADNNNVFKGVPFHSIEFKIVVTDQQGNVIVASSLPSDLIDGVVSNAKEAEDDDQFLGNLTNTASPSKDTFIIEHMSLSFLKVRSASGSWIADIDLSEPWMDKSPQELVDKLDTLLQAQRFFAFKHRDKTYRVRLAQVTGSDSPGFDERSARRINIVEIPITLGPLGNW